MPSKARVYSLIFTTALLIAGCDALTRNTSLNSHPGTEVWTTAEDYQQALGDISNRMKAADKKESVVAVRYKQAWIAWAKEHDVAADPIRRGYDRLRAHIRMRFAETTGNPAKAPRHRAITQQLEVSSFSTVQRTYIREVADILQAAEAEGASSQELIRSLQMLKQSAIRKLGDDAAVISNLVNVLVGGERYSQHRQRQAGTARQALYNVASVPTNNSKSRSPCDISSAPQVGSYGSAMGEMWWRFTGWMTGCVPGAAGGSFVGGVAGAATGCGILGGVGAELAGRHYVNMQLDTYRRDVRDWCMDCKYRSDNAALFCKSVRGG